MSYNSLYSYPVSGGTTLAQAQVRQAQPTQFANAGTSIINSQPIDHHIYSRAINISEPRIIGQDGVESIPANVTQKVVRRVEVPFTRQVKVPTQTTQIVPTIVEQRVPVKKLVEVQGYKTVEEQYTVYEEREAIRNKEIWVKKVVPEKYIERVPINKVRQVQKPTTVIKEIQTYETVAVPSTKAVQVPGYRVDEVQDSKMVEVEEEQEFQYKPEPVGEPHISATTDLGRIPGSHLSRSVGQDVFPHQHPVLREYDEDSTPGHLGGHTGQLGATYMANNVAQPSLGSTLYRTSNAPINGAFRASATRPLGAAYVTSPTSAQQQQSLEPADKDFQPAGSYRKLAQAGDNSNDGTNTSVVRSIGLTVDDTHTRHTDGTGVLVTKVERGQPGARAGLQPYDIITSVANRPTLTVDEFGQVLSRVSGPLSLTVNRDGRRNLSLTLYK